MTNEELAKIIVRRLGLAGQEWAYLAVLDELNSHRKP